MINLKKDDKVLAKTTKWVKDKGIIIPTFSQMVNPEKTPAKIKDKLKKVGLWDVDALNLFRITWKNEPKESGGGFGGVNYIEFPKELTGTKARIFALVGKWFPTGAHKVGAAFGCLAPPLIAGQFDPEGQKAVWPSTGNYCRGGAYVSALLSCDSIAILPEEMSQERFDWLEKIAGETIKTPGSESNVKEIFDKCWELKKSGQNLMIFNQFEEFGNYLWHYWVTGHAIEEVLKKELMGKNRFHGAVYTTGSAGTIGSGDYLKQVYPTMRIGGSEALQCPTLLENGFGEHRIEGIGDKHVPWIHNIKNTDMVMAIDDNLVVNLARLFNEKAGKDFLIKQKVPKEIVAKLDLLGFSGIANLTSAIKYAKYYELTENDAVFTILTDSMELYQSRLKEMKEEFGDYSTEDAAMDYGRYLQGITNDYMLEFRFQDRKRVHNLKYYTWVEQQGKTYEEINRQWYDENYWTDIQSKVDEIDEHINEFNKKVGLL
jgi:cysteine synthase